MNWFSAIVTFFLIWWTALFVVLPWGVKRDESIGTGAPENPMILKKLLWTTVVTVILWSLFFFLLQFDIIDFRAIAQSWSREDQG